MIIFFILLISINIKFIREAIAFFVRPCRPDKMSVPVCVCLWLIYPKIENFKSYKTISSIQPSFLSLLADRLQGYVLDPLRLLKNPLFLLLL